MANTEKYDEFLNPDILSEEDINGALVEELIHCADEGPEALKNLYEELPTAARFVFLDTCENICKEFEGFEYLVDFIRGGHQNVLSRSASQILNDLKTFAEEKRTELAGDYHQTMVDGLARSKRETPREIKGNEMAEGVKVDAGHKKHPAAPWKVLPEKKNYIDCPDPNRWQRG